MPEEAISEPNLTRPAEALSRPARGGKSRIWFAVLVAFVLGVSAAGWLGWRSGADFARLLGISHRLLPSVAAPVAQPVAVATFAPARAEQDEAGLATRIATLEQRLDQIDLRAEAASGNAARAEALLVAFAVRRVVERGAPLGYLADQLKLRFGDAQPNAVATIITNSKDLVPLDQLSARLEAMGPQLTDAGQPGLWARVTRELAEVFVIRRDRPVQSNNLGQIDAARMALSEGRIDDALNAVRRLPPSNDIANWSVAARRYRDVERALDLIDTTALLEPRQSRDVTGGPAASQTVPLTTPAPGPAPR